MKSHATDLRKTHCVECGKVVIGIKKNPPDICNECRKKLLVSLSDVKW